MGQKQRAAYRSHSSNSGRPRAFTSVATFNNVTYRYVTSSCSSSLSGNNVHRPAFCGTCCGSIRPPGEDIYPETDAPCQTAFYSQHTWLNITLAYLKKSQVLVALLLSGPKCPINCSDTHRMNDWLYVVQFLEEPGNTSDSSREAAWGRLETGLNEAASSLF